MSLLHHFFPKDDAFGYEALRAASYELDGGCQLGEVIDICSRIPSGDEEIWMREWAAAGDRATACAESSDVNVNPESAKEAYLRASNYYRTAEFFRRADPFNDTEAHLLYQKCVNSFCSAMKLTGYNFEEVEIPYGEKTLPAYFIKPEASPVPRKTIIFNGGFDSIKEESWFAIGAAALRRGFNFLAFDGPGQGLALRRDHLFFRPDWDKVLTPVMDYALDRADVASDKVIVLGWSLGGFLVAKAATEEHRAAAIVLDDGIFDFSHLVRKVLPTPVQDMIIKGPDPAVDVILGFFRTMSTGVRWALSNGKWAFGADSDADFVRKSFDYTLEGTVEKIKTPTLVLDAADDHFAKGQPPIVEQRLRCKKTLVSLTAEEGGGQHCHMGAFSRLHQVVFDYLGQVL